MRFKNWIKKNFIFNKEIDLKDYSKNKLANEKWIEHYFLIGFTFPDISKKEIEISLENQRQKLFDSVLGQIISKESINKKTLNKNVTILISKIKKINVSGYKGNYCQFLIRFVDKLAKDKKPKKDLGIEFRIKKNDKRSYLFSPLESIILLKLNILPSIEQGLITQMDIEIPEVMKKKGINKLFQFVNNEPYCIESDGIQYFGYPVKKRIELYIKNPELEQLVFKTKDNFEFNEFITQIMNTKNDNEHMKKYCQVVEKILKDLNIK